MEPRELAHGEKLEGPCLIGWLWQYRQELLALSKQALAQEYVVQWQRLRSKRMVSVPELRKRLWVAEAKEDGCVTTRGTGRTAGEALVNLALALGLKIEDDPDLV